MGRVSGTGWGPAATDTISRWGGRLLTADDGSRRSLTGSVDGAPHWLGGLAAGLQAALLSLAVVVVPTVAAYVATSADPTNQDVGWLRSVAVGAGLWLLGHGAPLAVDGVRVTLVPLGLTALALFTGYASARRSGRPTRSGWAAGVAAYVALAGVVALLAGTSDVVRAVLGAAAVAGVGLGGGLLAQPGAPRLRDLSRPLWGRVPAAVRLGATGGVMATAALLFVACGVVVGWLLAWRASVGDVVTNLGVDVIGWTTLALTQLALVPDLVVWALAFVAGPGFAVGSGTHFTPAEIVSGPLPALPLFGALPAPGSTSAVTAWWPLVTVVAGAGAGWWVHRRTQRGQWWHPLVACLTAATVAGAVTGALVGLASGAMGPGRMAEVGGSALLVGAAVGLGTLVGSALVALPFDPEVRTEASRRWRRVRPRPVLAVPDDAPTGELRVDGVGVGRPGVGGLDGGGIAEDDHGGPRDDESPADRGPDDATGPAGTTRADGADADGRSGSGDGPHGGRGTTSGDAAHDGGGGDADAGGEASGEAPGNGGFAVPADPAPADGGRRGLLRRGRRWHPVSGG